MDAFESAIVSQDTKALIVLYGQMARSLLNGVRSNMQPRDKKHSLAARHLSMLEVLSEMITKLQYLVDRMDKLGLLDEHSFTFPDGDTWEATREEVADA